MTEPRDDTRSQLVDLLLRSDWSALTRRAETDRGLLRALLARTYDPDDLVAWRAVDAIGRTAAVVARDDVEHVRRFIRRLLWSMNDESGGVGWHAAPTLGEILVHTPMLIDEYAVLLPNYLNEPPFERGAHLAVWRVARIAPQPLAHGVAELERSLRSDDASIRGFAVLALGCLAPDRAQTLAGPLLSDLEAVTTYDFDTSDWATTSVADMARSALAL